MARTVSKVGLMALGVAFAGIISSIPYVSAQTVVDLPPNLEPLPAFNFSLVSDTFGNELLRFSTTTWDSGAGPLQLEAGAVDTGSGKQQVNQRIFLSDGSSFLHASGWFEYHPSHNHMHFNDYALYTLQPVNAPGGSLLTGQKTTFCVMDTTKIDTKLPGAPKRAVWGSCGRTVQGMSVGWGDTYGSHLPGQEIDFTDNPDGIYQLKIEVDPNALIVESNKNDNVSCVMLGIKRPSTVTVLDSSGSCSTVISITPASAMINATIPVSITGIGFVNGMTVKFERGNGPRPVASNVILTNDTDTVDTITAFVTVPYKRRPGKDPVWDLRVSTGGVLKNAFTVTP